MFNDEEGSVGDGGAGRHPICWCSCWSLDAATDMLPKMSSMDRSAAEQLLKFNAELDMGLGGVAICKESRAD